MARKTSFTKIFMAVALSDKDGSGMVVCQTEDGKIHKKYNIENVPTRYDRKQRQAQGYIIGIAKFLKDLKELGLSSIEICTNNKNITSFLNHGDYRPIYRMVGDMPTRSRNSHPPINTLQRRIASVRNKDITGKTVNNDEPTFAQAFQEAHELADDAKARKEAKKVRRRERQGTNEPDPTVGLAGGSVDQALTMHANYE